MGEELSFDDAAKDVLRRAISRVEHLLRRLELPGPPIVVPAIGERPGAGPATAGAAPAQAPTVVEPPAPLATESAHPPAASDEELRTMRAEIESLRADAIADASLLLVDAQVIAASVLTQACGLAERTLDGADVSRTRAEELLMGAGAAAEDTRGAVDELVAALVAVRERLTERVDEVNGRIAAIAAVAAADR